MAKRNIFRGLAAVLALGMCMTGLAGCGNEKRADGKSALYKRKDYRKRETARVCAGHGVFERRNFKRNQKAGRSTHGND